MAERPVEPSFAAADLEVMSDAEKLRQLDLHGVMHARLLGTHIVI